MQITTKKDDSEYDLLNQLGGILGLTAKEIVDVHGAWLSRLLGSRLK